MHRALGSLLLFAALSGCGAGPPPEGFTVQVRFVSVDLVAVDQLRLSFTPQPAMTGLRFEPQEPMTFEGGAITSEVEVDGVFVLRISGDHVRAFAEGDPLSAAYAIEIFTEDEAMRDGPLVRGTVTNAGEAIAEGTRFLPAWPLPLGGSVPLQISCRAGQGIRCLP